MSLVHVEVVSSQYVAVCTSVDAVEIDTFLSCFSVCNYLFVPGDVLRFEPHNLSCRPIRNFANVGCVSAAKSWNFTMENVSQRSLRPG